MKSVKTTDMRKVNGGCIDSYYKCKLCGKKKLTFTGATLHGFVKHETVFPWSLLDFEIVEVKK
ncbi:MAG: hypothetical protein PUB37_05650 [Firmicutes bacterium]|nr:hypothetical protein [Bacillota bacterium]